MNMWIELLFLVVVGAVIGGLTNLIAIRMLFRPYNPWRIGKFHVPFTPGLIPKRRNQIAVQLGETVNKHLITPQGLQKKLTDPTFVKEMTQFSQLEVKKLLDSELTLHQFLAKHAQLTNGSETVSNKARAFLTEKLTDYIQRVKTQKVSDVLPDHVLHSLDDKVKELSSYILHKGVVFLQSEVGKQTLSKGVDAFLAERGMLVNMLSMFLGNTSIVEKLQPELIKLLQQPQTKETVSHLLVQEWEAVKSGNMAVIDHLVATEKLVVLASEKIMEQLPIDDLFHRPIHTMPSPYKERIVENYIPQLVLRLLGVLTERLPELLEKLQLAKIVEEQVETFSLQTLEEIIISVAKKELKMITWLGAILGGAIGFLQAFIVQVL
ncbi:hypothetical protein A374_08554 [Fictibacillus macauensis ZFHKF-1]|uniref:Uncharacterized protein n=1 Tax=Fictibacillus macauensis ZFHKF-1 TaxID=1196324 RepID=I8AJA6_9BACL|nr:DUF445 family protein [Fictibacillus macauensis]EIT85872.1 hypothetical protein A374_08554 [Fictibacillus macauensis ZFHKF-1]